MKTLDRTNLILRAYEIIGDATPLPADCGELCGGACCRGEEDDGMLLFPGEAALLSETRGFRLSHIQYMGGRAWLLSCEGSCDRTKRPLSCRVFPLAPLVLRDGTVEAVPDLRAVRMCPLSDGSCLDRRFRKRVARVFRLLAREPKMLGLMRLISLELEELAKFF